MNTLRSFLSAAGLTQSQFAELGGWRAATVSDWVRGRSVPSFANMLDIERLSGGAVPLAAWVPGSATIAATRENSVKTAVAAE